MEEFPRHAASHALHAGLPEPGIHRSRARIIAEVRPLFRSKYFNICADEIFDLGKGKNKRLAKRLGEGRLYVDFLKQILAAVRKAGAIPMFWGDIIGKHPKYLKELPCEVVALDWDYSPNLQHSIAPLIAKSGLPFYVCQKTRGLRAPEHRLGGFWSCQFARPLVPGFDPGGLRRLEHAIPRTFGDSL